MKEVTRKINFWGQRESPPGPPHAVHRTIRRSCRRRRPCRMRGRHGRRAHGPEDRALHAERGPDRADVVQPRGGRHRQGPSRPRSRRTRRHHGRDHRCSRHPVPPAEYLARTRRVVAARTMRQAGLPPEDARSPRVATESDDQASRSGGLDRGEQPSALSPQPSARERQRSCGDSRPRLSGRAKLDGCR